MSRCAVNVCFSTVIKRLIYIGLLCFTVSCAQKERPENVFSPDKMADVMLDVHLTQGITQARILTRDSALVSSEALTSFIYEKHQITEEDYLRSFDWYSDHLKDFDAVYARVIEKLNQMEAARMVDPVDD